MKLLRACMCKEETLTCMTVYFQEEPPENLVASPAHECEDEDSDDEVVGPASCLKTGAMHVAG